MLTNSRLFPTCASFDADYAAHKEALMQALEEKKQRYLKRMLFDISCFADDIGKRRTCNLEIGQEKQALFDEPVAVILRAVDEVLRLQRDIPVKRAEEQVHDIYVTLYTVGLLPREREASIADVIREKEGAVREGEIHRIYEYGN